MLHVFAFGGFVIFFSSTLFRVMCSEMPMNNSSVQLPLFAVIRLEFDNILILRNEFTMWKFI